MSTYEIACLILTIFIAIVTVANIIIWLLRERNKKQVVEDTTVVTQSEEPVEEVVEEPTEEEEEEPVAEDVAEDEEEPIDEIDAEYAEESTEEESQPEDNIDLVAALETGNVEESDSGATVLLADGTTFYIRYNKSFKAKLIQAKDEVREYYNIVKNEVLRYSNVKTSISWGQESVRFGKEKVCWLVLRGKSLYLYLPLDPDDYVDSKYKVERAKAKRYAELPCMYKITNNRRATYAADLIATVMERFDSERVERVSKDYISSYPYVETVELIKRKLIKVTRTNKAFPNK